MNTESTPTLNGTDVQQLSQAVASLAEALARSERRHALLARSLRWGVLGLVSLLVAAGFLMVDRFGVAHAQNPAGFPQATTAVDALNNINANLMLMGELGQALQRFSPAIRQTLMANPDVKKLVDAYREQNPDATQEDLDAYAMQRILGSMVGTFVDTVVLMQRIRQDSNAFRDYITGPEDVLRGVEQQLEVMNRAMASIPPMAVQMDLMNRNMASMTHSMGSTMGRMGNWMPW